MERLTTDRDYLVDKEVYERHLAQGYPRSTPQERFLKLCEYERTGHTPEEIAEFDNLYLAKCEEVNRLNAELTELRETIDKSSRKQTNADRIRAMSDEELAEFLVNVETQGYCDQSVAGTLEMSDWLQSEVEE